MNVLSIYPLGGIPYTHDANVCIANDDGVLFALEEERVSRGQHAIGQFPERAAFVGYRETGVHPASIDRLVTTSMESCRRKTDYRTRLAFAREMLQVGPDIADLCVPHHLAHSALSVLTSPFDECAFLTLDGGGDGGMGHWGVFREGRFRIVERCALSPAIFFSFVTNLCGFPLFEEGKVMGLSAYGSADAAAVDWFRTHFRIAPGSASMETPLKVSWRSEVDLNRVNADSFSRHRYQRWTIDFVGSEGRPGWFREIPPADLAKSGQVVFETMMLEIADNIARRAGIPALACGGGAFHNVTASGRLGTRLGDQLHVPVAPHDAGLAMGAALWTRHIHGRPRLQAPVTPFLGACYSADDVRGVAEEFGFRVEQPADFTATVASEIARGQIVGWFEGRGEYGARALGARSVLADPRQRTAKARLNHLLKRRDWFMPFAPAVLEERWIEYFEAPPSYYMNLAIEVRRNKRDTIPGAMHTDGTCRAQTISKTLQPSFHALVTAFNGATGVPMVLNTSFNRHTVPMVATPRQAIQHLLEGCIDVLAICGLVLRGRPRPEPMTLPDEGRMLTLMSVSRAVELARRSDVSAAQRLLDRARIRLSVTPDGLQDSIGGSWSFNANTMSLEQWWLARPEAQK